MMRYICVACTHGMHDACAGRNPPPPGMFGGSECICDGKCADRKFQSPAEQTLAIADALKASRLYSLDQERHK